MHQQRNAMKETEWNGTKMQCLLYGMQADTKSFFSAIAMQTTGTILYYTHTLKLDDNHEKKFCALWASIDPYSLSTTSTRFYVVHTKR